MLVIAASDLSLVVALPGIPNYAEPGPEKEELPATSAPRDLAMIRSREPLFGISNVTECDQSCTQSYSDDSAVLSERSTSTTRFLNQSGDSESRALRICRLVEGMPLALEMMLVAQTLTCQRNPQHLESGLDIWKVQARNVAGAPPQHSAVFEHSWNLWNPKQEAGCRCHSSQSFAARFRREAAER